MNGTSSTCYLYQDPDPTRLLCHGSGSRCWRFLSFITHSSCEKVQILTSVSPKSWFHGLAVIGPLAGNTVREWPKRGEWSRVRDPDPIVIRKKILIQTSRKIGSKSDNWSWLFSLNRLKIEQASYTNIETNFYHFLLTFLIKIPRNFVLRSIFDIL